MGTISVTPDPFHLVEYDAAVIRGIVEEVAGAVGIPPGVDIALVVDEALPHPILGTETNVIDGSIELWTSGGWFEARDKTRAFSERHARAVLTTMLMRARDRLSGGFEGAPPDSELTLAERAAWEAFAWGRATRLGHNVHRQKRIYDFRLQHGFTDAADAVFDRLWTSDSSSWGAIQEICVETGAVNRPKAKLPADLLRRGSRH